jgi:hypothetical protein
MNARQIIRIAIVAAAALGSGAAFAHGAQSPEPSAAAPASAQPMTYVNPAYTHAIPGAPNPVPETAARQTQAFYVDQADGPAIYSYPDRQPAAAAGDAR